MEGTARGLGKWGQMGVPHKGWSCTGIDDLEAPDAICEMCETVEIRFVHYMDHPDYPMRLACGEICAGHMSADYAGTHTRDMEMRKRAQRKTKFMLGWAQITETLEERWFRGWFISVRFKGGRYIAGVNHRGRHIGGAKDFPTAVAAKAAVFEYLDQQKQGERHGT